MSRFAEISSLFAALASNLQTLDHTARSEVDLSISDLNRSLNLSEAPRVRILDTALSLMCFTAPQVCDSVTEFTMRTIVTVLSSSIECKVLRNNKEQLLRVGGLISKSDCAKVMEGCVDILGKLHGHKGDICAVLSYAVIRVAALAPCFSHVIPATSGLKMKCSDYSNSALASLVGHLPNELTYQNGEIPLRLLLWYLDPMILKQDVSQILKEIIMRPFLSLSIELYSRIAWRSKIICLVMSPSMFVETRAFVHSWFLMTGLATVLELQTELVRQVLDIISRPIWWGIPMEVGMKLPFSHAYFPYEHHLLRVLAGPVSHEYFQHLLYEISGLVSHSGDHLHASSTNTARKTNIVDHKSLWSMVMNFPAWFSFASMLLFCDNSPAEAAKFIAWILNPTSKANQYLIADYLVEVSELWTLKCSSSSKCNKATMFHVEETRESKLLDNDEIISYELDNLAVSLWLKEFNPPASSCKGFSIHQNLLLRKIPLGILLVSPNHLNAAGCSLVLHYAATGNIHMLPDTQKSVQSQKRWKHNCQEDSIKWIQQYTKAETIARCKTVFDITDVAESISPSIFETEEEALNFICQLKLKTCNYLLKCIKRLLEIRLDGDGHQMQRDLFSRVMRWRHQGKDVFQKDKDMECVCDALNV